ncbi:MAG: hypothetical protein R6U36_10430 [Candidatus Fermentibacteraceae bacterium]
MTADRPGLHRLLEPYWDSGKPARGEVRERVWTDFGGRGAVLITDMSGFSRVTRDMGIVHYLAMIRRMQRIMVPPVHSYAGRPLSRRPLPGEPGAGWDGLSRCHAADDSVV